MGVEFVQTHRGFEHTPGVSGRIDDVFLVVSDSSSVDQQDDLIVELVAGVSLDVKLEIVVVDGDFGENHKLLVGHLTDVLSSRVMNGLLRLHGHVYGRTLDFGKTLIVNNEVLGEDSTGKGRTEDAADQDDGQEHAHNDGLLEALVFSSLEVEVVDGVGQLVDTQFPIVVRVQLESVRTDGFRKLAEFYRIGLMYLRDSRAHDN